ncbi:hypothetical protein FS837_011286 [Tulasnella sp. UAMH 9824]|nr:hypothetical protein FS837_011286 [Tulasnella sp. UAMH 9824]
MMPKRTNSSPTPKTPVSPNAQTTSTNPVSPLQDSTFAPMSPQRRANTYPAERPKSTEIEGQSAQDFQDAPYTTTPQAGEADLPDFLIFANSPGNAQWQTSQSVDGTTLFSTSGVTVEVMASEW